MNPKFPEVSVLITSKNNADKLDNLIASVRAQTYSSVEIILIDDGSTPPHPDFGADVFVRHVESVGLIKSRNELARLGRGKYFLFVDDDVVLPDPNFVAKAVSVLELHPDCGAMAFGEIVPGFGESCLQPSPATHVCYVARYFGWTYLFRADVWRASGGLCELFDYGFEETEHSIRLLDSGVRLIYDPGLKVIHDSASLSKAKDLRRNQNYRNQIFTALMLISITALPEAIVSTLQSIYKENRSAGISRWRSVFWCIWAVSESFVKVRQIYHLRKPARRETFHLVSKLGCFPFHAPPDYPS